MGHLSLKAQPPAVLVTALLKMLADTKYKHAIQLHIETTLPGHSHDANGQAEELLKPGPTAAFLKQLADRPAIGCTICEIKCAHPPGSADFRHTVLKYESADRVVASLLLQQQKELPALVLYDAAAKHVPIISEGQLFTGLHSATEGSALRAQQAAVAEMSALSQQLATFLAKQIEEHGHFIEEATRRLQDAARTQSEEFMALISNREQEIAATREAGEAAIRARVQAFEAEKAAFDARASTVVRRENLQELRKIITSQSEARVSRPTQGKRRPIHILCAVALAGFGLLGICLSYKVLTSTAADWHLLAPLGATLLGFGMTLIYYIRWLDAWFHAHSDREIGAQQAQADIIRANWLAELMFEWDKEKAIEFPADLMRTFSQGLFESSATPRARHPIEDVADLVDRLTRVRLSAEGVEIEKKSRG